MTRRARHRPTRRATLAGIAAVASAGLAGCDQEDATALAARLVSPEQMQHLGLQTWQQIRSQVAPSRDTALQQRLRQIGERVVAASGTHEPEWEFQVFASPQINAFAVPGGRVGFFEGMFGVARNDAQVAAVLGHEIGHINARHAAQRLLAAMVKETGLQALSLALQVGQVPFSREIAAMLGAGLEYGLVLPYSRRQEYEADALGVRYMAGANYPPEQAIAFWKQMIALNRNGPKPLAFLSTHPADQARMAELQEKAQATQRLPARPA